MKAHAHSTVVDLKLLEPTSMATDMGMYIGMLFLCASVWSRVLLGLDGKSNPINRVYNTSHASQDSKTFRFPFLIK